MANDSVLPAGAQATTAAGDLHAAVARAAIAGAPAPALLVDASGVHANAAAARWLAGLDASLACSDAPLPSAHPLTIALRHAALTAARDAGTALPLILPPHTPHGTLTASALGVAGTLPVVAWLQPTTPSDRGDDPQALIDRLTLAVQTADIGIWDYDVASDCAIWNAQQYALHGLPADVLPPDFAAWLEMIHPDDRPHALDCMQRLSTEGDRMEGSHRVLRPDGSVVQVRWQAMAVRDGLGRVVRMIGANRDVTAEVQAARERDQVLKRLQLATQVARIGVWETHLETREEHLDDATSRMLGFGPGPQVRPTDDFLAMVHPDDRAGLNAQFGGAVRGRDAFTPPLAFRIVRDGEERHLLSHCLIERRADGRAERVLGTVYDVTELKRAEQAMRAVAERLEIATRLGGLSVFERDAQDRLIYFDGFLISIYGRTPDGRVPTIDEGIARVVPEDRERFIAARAQMKQADEPVRCEYRSRHDDGRVHDLLSWRRRRIDEQGKYAGEIGALIDITELRAAERRAREYAAWLEIAADSAGMGVWELDVEAQVVVFDDRAHRLFGDRVPPSPMPANTFEALIDAADLPRIQSAIAAALAPGGAPLDTEYRIHLSTGPRIFAVRGEATREAGGRGVRMMGVVWDVTERRAAEAAARESAERLQLAALGAGIGCWEYAFDGHRGVWDEQMYRLYGATPADGTPQEVTRQRVLAEDWPVLDTARRESWVRGEFAVAYRIRRSDGEVRWLSGRGRVRYGTDGKPRSVVGVTWDVTDAREAEAALRAKETAERASQAKSEFLSRMSHELRTPLNAIVGFTQLLELDRNDPLSATQRERVGLIRSSGWHLLNLINDVLDLARIESGRSAVSMEVVRWPAVLDEAIAMVQTEAASRGIVVESRSGGDAAMTVWADPVRLRQVLLNLLSNAVKYNRDRGSVQVTVRADGSHIVFAVRDTGRGMNPGQVSRLFQPFNRLGVDGTSPAGTGIGLAISQRLVQQMDGAIEVDSTPGVGSEFRLRLRAARMEAAQPVALPPPPAAGLAARDDVTGTLLYIEDNPANSALVEQFLQFRPHIKLYQAADGATGLVMAAVCQPDLVLIDIRLPDMMGDEVLRQLRRQPETQRIACVAVSANAMPHDIDAALEAGFADYWTKPLDVAQFLRGIDRLLAAAQAAPAPSPHQDAAP